MAALLRFYGIVAACFVGYPASGLPILTGEPSKPSAAYITTRNITQFGPPKIHYMAPPNSNVFEWRDACALRVVIYNSTEKLNHGYDGCGHPELQGGCAWPEPRCPVGWQVVSTHNVMEPAVSTGCIDTSESGMPGTNTCAACVTEAVCKSP